MITSRVSAQSEPELPDYNGPGSGSDDLADFNQNEEQDYRDEDNTGPWCDEESEAERNL